MSAETTLVADAAAIPVSLGAGAERHLAVERFSSALCDYVSLMKPRIIVLLVLTQLTTMVIAARGMPPVSLLVWAVVGGVLASGGAGAINCWYDRDIDSVMSRTRSRPLPTGRIKPLQALSFGIALLVASAVVFVLMVNTLAAVLALAGGGFYVLVYTMLLKRSTPLNIVIGGAAGAFPPLVAWASVRGDVGWPALALFAIVFLWTPPHFWSLALLLRDDYRRVHVPMMPVLVGTARTYRRILGYLLALIGASLLPGLGLGFGYAGPVALLGLVYVGVALAARRANTSRATAMLFEYSLLYLALVFVCGALAASV